MESYLSLGLLNDEERQGHEDGRITMTALDLWNRHRQRLYAGLLEINAYHQPGVEAGKKAAASIFALQGKVVAALSKTPSTAEQVAATTGVPESAETVYLLLEHLAANGRARAAVADDPGQTTFVRA
jgi:hypothetical protein